MQEFFDYQSNRKLLPTESLVQYIYAKNAMLQKSPYELAPDERISLILHGIPDDRWANPLASHHCTSVLELIDRATALDSRRSLELSHLSQPRPQKSPVTKDTTRPLSTNVQKQLPRNAHSSNSERAQPSSIADSQLQMPRSHVRPRIASLSPT